MCQFLQGTKLPIFVNVDAVRIVKANRDGGTDVIFDNNQAITVKEELEEVITRLEKANSAIQPVSGSPSAASRL
jgi:hypothetical protein